MTLLKDAHPTLFVSHGSPVVAIEDDGYTRALRDAGRTMPHPRAIVALSAHWQREAPFRVTAAERPATMHDFAGFPAELHALAYPAPGSPGLAGRIVERLRAASLPATPDARRGLDHGAWVPLRLMYPEADIPVVEVSFPPDLRPAELLRMGAALANLRREGILLVGSGGIVHNLQEVRFEEKSATIDLWARTFDTWAAERIAALDTDSLLHYREKAPHVERAVPTREHFDPLFFILGTAAPGDRVSFIYEGFQYGNLSMRTFTLGC
jgi:4,5-DOPA dioxygenase extradiol